ncbi:alpha/beta fold hydrolase BchO [Pseudaestuariivita sp.]|uniref:alpha/beta fold hydrolase BchO n=1 Tax=Pseudaestuariivita sp. TaxID=2211669 RepID=UPI0040589FBF
MHWPRDLEGWPHRDRSTRVSGPVHRWHVQTFDDAPRAPELLLLHGAGGSTHSWAALAPLLAREWRLRIVDLPGHGFTTLGTRNRSGLQPMARDVAALVAAQGWQPKAIVGHSAGVAIALQMTLEGPLRGRPVIGINAALGPFPGLAGVIFPVLAQVMASAPFVPRLVSRQIGNDRQIARLIESTGSTLDAEGCALYRRLASNPDHIAGTLRMMAQWDLAPLLEALSAHPSRALLITGAQDSTVPPHVSDKAAAQMPDAEAVHLAGLGHLAHEEAPESVLATCAGALERIKAY